MVEPRERTAEVYSYDGQLKATFTLGEGRQSLTVSEYSFDISHTGPSSNEENSERSRERVLSDVAALLKGDKEELLRQVLQMPEKQREIVLQSLSNQ